MLFPCVEVSHRLIVCPRAQSIDRLTGGCEHLLAEGVRHLASVRVACGVNTGGPFSLRCCTLSGRPTLPEAPRDRFRVHPAGLSRLTESSFAVRLATAPARLDL